VKVAFVVGFFNPVEAALKDAFEEDLDGGTLICVSKTSSRYAFDVNKFKSQFFQKAAASDVESILVIAADLRGQEWLTANLQQMVDAARARSGGKNIQLELQKDAQNPTPVIDSINQYGLAKSGECAGGEVSELELMAYTHSKKVLCVRGKNQSGFEDALRRANFKFTNFENHFVELELSYGSNVGQTLKDSAKHHICLLYAWGELKYLQPATKSKWQNLHQGENPAAAVARFKQAVQSNASQKKK
jgi:hypothetical protein